jgi:hypothetical protein
MASDKADALRVRAVQAWVRAKRARLAAFAAKTRLQARREQTRGLIDKSNALAAQRCLSRD